MCGIIGLMLKNEELRPSLGKLVLPMFDCMAERGPDSAGLAVFTNAVYSCCGGSACSAASVITTGAPSRDQRRPNSVVSQLYPYMTIRPS